MSRINSVQAPQGRAKDLLDQVQKAFGAVPNIFRIMANSPATLEAFLNFNGGLAKGTLSPALRAQIALAVAGANSCDYCASAHTALGKKAGLTGPDLSASLKSKSGDPKVQAALTFAKNVVNLKGNVTDADLRLLRDNGYSDGEIVEIVANVAVNIFTNYFNHVAKTEIDFPLVKAAA